jgi:hypothetical protein
VAQLPLKTELRTRPATSKRDAINAIKRMVSTFLLTLASLPQRVMAYFKYEHVTYASTEAVYCV